MRTLQLVVVDEEEVAAGLAAAACCLCVCCRHARQRCQPDTIRAPTASPVTAATVATCFVVNELLPLQLVAFILHDC